MTADPQMRWLRLWTDILEDPKLLLLAPGDRWYYIGILALKRTGLLDERDSAEMRDRKVALRLRLDAPERDELRRRLTEVRLIDKDWQPVGWEKRQFDSDTSAARTRKWREKKRRSDGLVTTKESHGDVTVTDQSRDRAETETEQNPPHAPPSPGPDPSFTPTTAGAVCVAMKSVGVMDPSPAHPKLLALIGRGATLAHFAEAGRASAERRKGFAYALGIVERELADGQRIAQLPRATEPERRWEPPDDEPEVTHAAV